MKTVGAPDVRTLSRAACQIGAVLATVCLLVAPPPSVAQVSLLKRPAAEAAAVAKPEPVSVEQLRQRLTDAQSALAAVDGSERLATGAPLETPDAELQLRARMLRLQTFAYRQHIAALDNLAEQKKLAADAETKRKAWAGFAEKPPYSILMIDGMRAELQGSQLELRSEEARAKIVAAQIDNGKEQLAKASERHRRAQEKLEEAKPSEATAATWRRDLARLEERAFSAYLESLVAHRELVEGRLAEARQAAEFVQRKIGEVEKSVAFRAQDLERLKAGIEARRAATVDDLDRATGERERFAAEVLRTSERHAAAEKQVGELQQQLAEANKQLGVAETDAAKAEKPESFLQKLNPLRGRSEKAELDKRRSEAADLERRLAAARAAMVARERERALAVERSRNAAHAVETLGVSLTALDMQRAFWDLRFSAMDGEGAVAVDRRKMYEGSRKILDILNPAVEYLRTKMEAMIGEVAGQQSLLRAAADSGETTFRKSLLELLAERERLYLNAFAHIEEPRQLLLRWVEEQDKASGALSAGDRAQDWLGVAGEWVKAVWLYELFTVEDSIVVDGKTITGSRGVTVAKVVQAILIMVVGYFVAALLTRLMLGLAARRLAIDPTSARIARKWVLAVIFLFLLLISMNVVKIPFTAFAFLGGAVAIAAGFGMQTLLKNLISGIMLLLERPFRPRDFVEVGGIRGEVTDINVRSCTIRDANGIETLVPNSTFLEQNVTNWTLSNRQVRYSLNVGVAYGSPARQVADLLLQVAGSHAGVLKAPTPEVLFVDFGDNALLFTLNVWLEIGPGRVGANVVLSDLRFLIDECFAQHGIAIPFPQRDVHVDASTPLPVRVVVDDGAG